MARVVLEKIKKEYENGFVAVHAADIEIEDGEFVVLVGPSGCGKSTTLRMIAGLESITDGKLFIDDRLVNDVPPKDRDIAMVFQNYALYPHMSVFDNMAFGLKLRKYSKAEIKERVDNAARILSIESILDRKPKQLSGGQRQRVAVGRAIVRKPKVFLFDEPLSNLDAKLRVQMRTEISKLHRTLNSTMVYVTHDQVEAMTMGDRIVVLKDGVIQQVDTPLNLYNHPKNRFVAGFIGSPAMNFVSGSIRKDGGVRFVSDSEALSVKLPPADADVLSAYEGKPVILGVRPEDVYVSGSENATVSMAPMNDLLLEVVEPMGNEIFIYTRGDNGSVVGRIAPQSLPPVGDAITLSLDVNKLHYFDGESEVTLTARKKMR